MKYWEAVKELTDDPKKVFVLEERYKKWTLKTDYDGKCPNETMLYYLLECVGDDSVGESGGFSGNLTTNCSGWQEVKQPVTWQEAIQAGSKGRMVRVEFEDGYKKQLDLFNRNTFSFGDINNGTWYIED